VDLILTQIFGDFEDLVRLTERALEAHSGADENAETLRRARDAAYFGAVLARRALDQSSK